MKQNSYHVLLAQAIPEMSGAWEGAVWRNAASLAVHCFRSEGSKHRPQTFCKLLYDERKIFGIFRVADQYVRCVHTGFQSDVWKDSCVELFVQPPESRGYFNFEFNCGGALLASYVTNPLRIAGRLQECFPLDLHDDLQIRRYASLPQIVEPEITTPTVWYLEFSIPLSVLEKYAGQLGALKKQTWRGNFYKCGNETSHPHWASWAPLACRNFHDPASFGSLTFVSSSL